MKNENMRKNLAMDSKPHSDQAPISETLSDVNDPEMRAHYSFQGGQRGRYAHLFPQTPHLVVLSPDMAAVFPDSDSVNEALRTLVKAVQAGVPPPSEREAA
jgi:hypothetical protein